MKWSYLLTRLGKFKNLRMLAFQNEILSTTLLKEVIFQKTIYMYIYLFSAYLLLTFEPPHDKTNKMACASNKDVTNMPSLIRVFAVRLKKAWVLSYPLSTQRRLWSDWADAQADLSLCWALMLFWWFCHESDHFMIYATGTISWVFKYMCMYVLSSKFSLHACKY